MSYAGKITTVSGDTSLVGSALYGTCSTAASTVMKEVTLTDFDYLMTGITVYVKFTYSNTAADPTLKVGSTTAAAIKQDGSTAGTEWEAGAVIPFTYDGTYWMMSGGSGSGGSVTWVDV